MLPICSTHCSTYEAVVNSTQTLRYLSTTILRHAMIKAPTKVEGKQLVHSAQCIAIRHTRLLR